MNESILGCSVNSKVRLVLRDGRIIEGDDARAVADLARLLEENGVSSEPKHQAEAVAENRKSPASEVHLKGPRDAALSLTLLDTGSFKRQAKDRLRVYLDANRRFRVIDAMEAWLADSIPTELPTGDQNPIYPKSLRIVKGEIEEYRRKHGLGKTQFRIGRLMAYHLHAPGEQPNTFDFDAALGPKPPTAEEVAQFIDGLPGDKAHTMATITEKFARRPLNSKVPGTMKQNPVYALWQNCARTARTLLSEQKGLLFEPVGKGPRIGFRLASKSDSHGGSGRSQKRTSEGMGSSKSKEDADA